MPLAISCAAFDAPPHEVSPATAVRAILDWAWETFQEVPTLLCKGVPIVLSAHRRVTLLHALLPEEEIPSTTMRWLVGLLCPLDRPIGELAPWTDSGRCALVPGSTVLRRVKVEVQGLGIQPKAFGCFAHHTVAELKDLLVLGLALWCPATSLQLWQGGSVLQGHMTVGDLPDDRITMGYLSPSVWMDKFVLQLSPAPNSERVPPALAIDLTVTTSLASSQLPPSLVDGVASLDMHLHRIHPLLFRLDHGACTVKVWNKAEVVTGWLSLACRHAGLGRDLLLIIVDFLCCPNLQPSSVVPSASAVTIPQGNRISRVLVPGRPLEPQSHYMVTTSLPPTGQQSGYAMQLKRTWHFYTGPESATTEIRDPWTTDINFL